MTNEEAVLAEAETVVSQAVTEYISKKKQWALDMFNKMEESLAKSEPLTSTYDLWAARLAYSGTTDGVVDFAARLKDNDPEVQVLSTSASDELEANACVGLQHCWTAEPGMPENIKGVLSEMTPVMMLHQHTDLGELAGILVRSKAFATENLDVRPSEADDRVDVIITSVVLGGYLYTRVRRESDGSLFPSEAENKPSLIEVAHFEKPDDKNNIAKQALALREEHGELAFLLYCALYMPAVMKVADPALYDAMMKDALSSADDEEGNTQTTGEDNQ